MKHWIPAIVSVIGGLFTISAAITAWKLNNSTARKATAAALEKQRRAETKQLYTQIFILFEQAIKHGFNTEKSSLPPDFSEANAKIHLLAPEPIGAVYHATIALLENWSTLQRDATCPYEQNSVTKP